MPFYKIGIDCNLAGADEYYVVEAPTECDASDMAEALALETYQPYGWVEKEISEEEIDEEGLFYA